MPTDLQAIRERHHLYPDGDGPWCEGCGQDYPCDAARLAALLTVENVARAYHSVFCSKLKDGPTPGRDDFALATALLAALEAEPPKVDGTMSDAELRKLAEAATPGPWDRGGSFTAAGMAVHTPNGALIADHIYASDAAYIAAFIPT